MNSELHFAVYEHRLVLTDKQIITRKFIVLKEGQTIRFTDFHRYLISKNPIQNLSSDGGTKFDYIVPFLNFLYFDKHIQSLDMLTVNNVSEYLTLYGIGKLPRDNRTQGRKKATVNTCVSTIMDFLEHFIDDRKGSCLIKKSDLYKTIPTRTKRGKTVLMKRPVFEVMYNGVGREIFRDIPNSAFDVIFNIFFNNHKELLGLISLSAFGGLRPSEACNVRREDSSLGPGILFTRIGDEVIRIDIDLLHEYVLRSDLISVGKIKKERMATIPAMFNEILLECYEEYLNFIKGKKYEDEYGPLNINRSGKAMTYDAYYAAFKTVIATEVVPALLASNDPELVIYGRLVLEHGISPHIFRHWYSVQLVLAGVDSVNELMFYRGDRSPESALTYLNNKGELLKKYRKVSDSAFDYLSWAAKKKHVCQ